MADFWYRCSLWIVPPLAAGLIRLWFASCRLKVGGEENLHTVLAGQGGIALFWHYSFLYAFYFFRRYPAAIMVSASRDGEYIARLARVMGHVPVRGSSHRHGARALREIIACTRQSGNAALVADGSQGPPRRLQPGCLLVAAKTGKPILPLAWAASRSLRFRSWDRTVLPLPFCTVVLRCGEPFSVPASLSAGELEQCRLELEERLNRLYEEVWAELGLPPHDQDADGTGRRG